MNAKTPAAVNATSSPAALPSCAHCSQEVPLSLVKEDAQLQFCCHGCETAYSIIHSCGLDRYYALRDALPGGQLEPAQATGRTYADFDDPVFHRLYVRGMPGGLSTTEFFLRGVHCSACVWLVERLPKLAKGVIEARLDLRRAVVRVVWDPTTISLSQVARMLDAIGYPPHPARDVRAGQVRKAEDRRMLIRIAVAGACAGNAMLFAFALYAGLFDAMEPTYREFFRWGSMAVTLVCLLWPGSIFFRSALGALRARSLHLDIPIALALGAGLVWSVFSTIRGHGEVYFDSLSVLVFALLVGRFIQHRQQRWAGDAVELLFSLTPSTARRVEGPAIREVPVEALSVGDIVEVRAGDSFPADGDVEFGASHADASLLTGEPVPVAVRCGDAVHAGTVNVGAMVRVRVTASGEETRVAKLMHMVEQGASRRAGVVRLADRASGWFVAGMLLLSAATLAVWAFIDPEKAVDHAVSLLIVTCPCALGLATPLALTVALGRAARHGLLIKGGDAVQRLASPGVIFLDKTGTLTCGRLSLLDWVGEARLKPFLAALETHSAHPIARALVRDIGLSTRTAIDVTQTTGEGICGKVDGVEIFAGSINAAIRRSDFAPNHLLAAAESAAARGLTPVAVVANGLLEAVAVMGDALRSDAPALVETLRNLGWRPRILSGDHPDAVASVAKGLGIEWARGGQSPEAKLHEVETAAKSSPVVMVGDGVNDAAALAAAGVGIAVHGGAEASLSAADVYVSKPGLSHLVELVEGCRRTMSIVKINLGASLVYNFTAAIMAVTGHINPIAAAVIMPISSLTVLAISFRSRSFGRSA